MYIDTLNTSHARPKKKTKGPAASVSLDTLHHPFAFHLSSRLSFGANLYVDADAHGLAEAEVGQGVHGGVERGGEEQRLPLRRAAADQLFDFVLEAELEQTVHFVEHEHVHVVQVHALGEGLGEGLGKGLGQGLR